MRDVRRPAVQFELTGARDDLWKHASKIELEGRTYGWPDDDGAWDVVRTLRTAADWLDAQLPAIPPAIPPAIIRGAFEAGWEAAMEGVSEEDEYTVDDAWAEYEYPPAAGCVPLEELEALAGRWADENIPGVGNQLLDLIAQHTGGKT